MLLWMLSRFGVGCTGMHRMLMYPLLATAVALATTSPTGANLASATSNLPANGSSELNATRVYYVARTGSDTNPGTLDQPFRTVNKGLSVLVAGDKLVIRGGEYAENIQRTSNKGTATAPITVTRYTGERPVIRGLLKLRYADYWVLDGINVTWNNNNSSNQHMVVMQGGVGWTIKNSELWGAKSYAALHITGGANKFSLRYNRIHDTYASNSTGQDHLIYVNNAIGGTIERNLLYNSPNGRAIKVGSLSNTVDYPRNVTIRYNTMYNNLGPSNLQFSYSANNNRACRNIFQKAESKHHNVTWYNLSGDDNIVCEDVGWEARGVVEPGNAGLIDQGNSRFINPQFADVANYDFHPRNPDAQAYGRYAP